MIEPFYMRVSKRIKRLREKAGISQESVAIELGLAGRQGVHLIESGVVRLRLDYAVRLAELFEVTLEDLTE